MLNWSNAKPCEAQCAQGWGDAETGCESSSSSVMSTLFHASLRHTDMHIRLSHDDSHLIQNQKRANLNSGRHDSLDHYLLLS